MFEEYGPGTSIKVTTDVFLNIGFFVADVGFARYELMGDNPLWVEMVTWCYNAFGGAQHLDLTNLRPLKDEDVRYFLHNGKIYFKHEEDLNFFLLRWNLT